MKIEICIEDGENGKEMDKKPTAFHKKVAQMIAKQKGRSKANDMDLEKAMDLDEEDDS